MADLEAIKREVPLVTNLTPQSDTSAQIIYGNQNWRTQLRGISPEYLALRKWSVVKGVMNIMLVSVTERTKEIGLRLSVGARGSDVKLHFLWEAVMLSIAGGLVGTEIGFASSIWLATLMEWPVSVSANAVFVAVAFSAAVGIFFGYYPAQKAVRLDPIDAIRYEG